MPGDARNYRDAHWTPQAIKAAREAAGWTRERMATELGCSATTVARLERGDIAPYDSVCERLDDLSGAEHDRLFDRIEVDTWHATED